MVHHSFVVLVVSCHVPFRIPNADNIGSNLFLRPYKSGPRAMLLIVASVIGPLLGSGLACGPCNDEGGGGGGRGGRREEGGGRREEGGGRREEGGGRREEGGGKRKSNNKISFLEQVPTRIPCI